MRRAATPGLALRLFAEAAGAEFVREHRFHPVRKWRFDYACPSLRIAVEVDGGAWIYGRHNRPAGFIADMEKLNAAAAAGWTVLRLTPAALASRYSLALIRETAEMKRHSQTLKDTMIWKQESTH